jgi:hypothetical protein
VSLEERREENARKEEHTKILLENALTALIDSFARTSDFEGTFFWLLKDVLNKWPFMKLLPFLSNARVSV